jgi:fumarate hydratase class I
MEQEILKMTQSLGVGAQFGGKYFCHDVRVIRLPRHGASLPIGLGVSCSADRQAVGKITKDGVFLEELEHNPAKVSSRDRGEFARRRGGADRPEPADERDLATLSQYPIKTRVSLTGTMIVARDPRMASCASGWSAARGCRTISRTIRSTTRARRRRRRAMPPDRSARPRQGGWTPSSTSSRPPAVRMVMVAKGNRAPAVREACKKHGGFYLGSIGGAAANLAEHCIKKVEAVEYPELGMEAIWRIEVVDFPGLHRHRRQGQRLLPGAESGVRAAAISIHTRQWVRAMRGPMTSSGGNPA